MEFLYFFCCSEYELKLSIAGLRSVSVYYGLHIMVGSRRVWPALVIGLGPPLYAASSARQRLVTGGVNRRLAGGEWLSGHQVFSAVPHIEHSLWFICCMYFCLQNKLLKKKLTFTCCVPLQKQP